MADGGGVAGSYDAMIRRQQATDGAGPADLLKLAGNSTPKELPSIVGMLQVRGPPFNHA